MRPIDADKLIEKIKKTYCERCDNYNGMRCKACPNDDEIRDIDSAPTIDAVSVVHGEWIEAEEDWRQQIAFWRCSECGHTTSTMHNFCPNCGAKMKGADDGDNNQMR